MSFELEGNELYHFVKDFPHSIQSITVTNDAVQLFNRLLNGAPELLTVYPSVPLVIEAVCLALIEAVTIKETRYSTIDFEIDTDAVIFMATSLTQVQWLTLSSRLLGLACESLTTMLTFYPQELAGLHAVPAVAAFIQESFTHVRDSNEHLISLGSAFPSNLPSSFYNQFMEFGIFNEIHNLVRLYTEMSEQDFTAIIKVISSFLHSEPSVCGSSLLSESTHFMLLFAAQHFASVYEAQDALWSLLLILFTDVCDQWLEEVDPSVIVPAVHATLTTSDCGLRPIVNFLGHCITSSSDMDPPLVVYCLEGYSKVLDVLFLCPLDPYRRGSHPLSVKERDDMTAVVELSELFFQDFTPKYSTIDYIVNYKLLDVLKEAALTWPGVCCLSYCTAFRRLLEHFRPINGRLSEKIQDIMKQFFSEENQVLFPFVDLLCNPGTYASPTIRVGIYHLISSLLNVMPTASLEPSGLNGEFLMSFISGLSRDVREIPQKIQDFVSLAHDVIHCLKPDQLRIIRDQKWHEVVVNCIITTSAASPGAVLCIIKLSACMLQTYSHSFNDVMPFITDCDFAQLTLRLAKVCNIPQLFSVIVLSLTADRKAAFALYESGSFISNLIPFIQDPVNFEAAINAIGNVLLTNDKAKQEMVDRGLHMMLIELLDTSSTSLHGYDPLLVSACCRVLHVLAMAPGIKYILVENNLTQLLLKLIDFVACDGISVHCQALGLLKCLEYFSDSQSTEKYVFPEKILKSLAHLLNANSNCFSADDCYIALVFLLSIEDKSVSVIEVFSQVLQEGSRDEFTRLSQCLPHSGTAAVVKMVTIPMTSKLLPLTVEEQSLLGSYIEQCIMSPVKPRLMKCGEDNDEVFETQFSDVSDDLHPFPGFPEGPKLQDAAIDELTQLGLNPTDNLFRIERFYCNTYSEHSFMPLDLTPQQYQELIDRGWYRRGGEGMYRFQKGTNFDVCEWETRVTIAGFDHKKHKSYKKVLKRMPEDRLTIKTIPTQFIPEAFDLYNSYQSRRHGFRAVSKETYYRKCVDSPLRNQSIDGFQYGSFHQLYYLDGKLVAVGVIDVVPNGVLSMYMWYNLDKEVSKYSFGIYSTLKEIEFAKNLSKCNPNIKYYYLQGWRHSNSRLSYKARYEPEEFYCPGIVPNWMQGLNNVMQEIANAKQKWLQLGEDERLLSDDYDESRTRVCIPGDAYSMDHTAYNAHCSPNDASELDVMNTVVCIDQQVYMYLGQMLETFGIDEYNRWRVEKYFRALYYAVGPQGLARNMIVDFKTSDTTGYPLELGAQ